MLAFFNVARQEITDLRFMILTPQTAIARERAAAAGLQERILTRYVPPNEVPAYLAAADAGISLNKRIASKRASSPTKHGEYLASGLAVVADSWTGDSSRFSDEEPWVAVREFTDEEYRRATERLRRLLTTPALARQQARALAEREFDLRVAVDRYDTLYKRLSEVE
jgi:glycosyltransferase involved in cell wall biosynthesis